MEKKDWWFIGIILFLYLISAAISIYLTQEEPLLEKFKVGFMIAGIFIPILIGVVGWIIMAKQFKLNIKQKELSEEQIKLADKQIKISGIQTQINQFGLRTTRAENQRAESFSTARKFKDSKDPEEIKKANELVIEGNKMTDMIKKRDNETREWIKKLNNVLNDDIDKTEE